MKYFKLAIFLTLSLCFYYSNSQILDDAQMCTGVKSLQPVNSTSSFSAGQRAYCWIKLSDAIIGSSIKVEWYCNDALQHTSTLSTKYASMRTYTYKTVSTSGNWRADIKTKNGKLLKSLTFFVGNGMVGNENSNDTSICTKVPKESYDQPLTKDSYILKDSINNKISDFEATLVLPPGYDKNKKYPVLVTYPCTGGTGYWLLGTEKGLEQSKYENAFAEFLKKLYPNAKERKEKSFILFMPGGRGSEADHSWQGFSMCIERYDNHVKSNLRTYAQKYNIDTTKIFAAGYSLGGDLSWALSLKNPEMYKGAVIMGSRCSYPDKGSLAKLAKRGARFYMGMGEYEENVRIKGNNYAKSLLEKNSIPFEYYQVPGGGHVDLPADKLLEALRFIMK